MTKIPPSFYNSNEFGHILGRRSLCLWIREFLIKSEIDGFFLEYGTFNGESLKEFYYCFRDTVNGYIGLDSFQGLPIPTEFDNKIALQPQFVAGNASQPPLDDGIQEVEVYRFGNIVVGTEVSSFQLVVMVCQGGQK